jgi:hypothetical protein
MLGIVPLKEMHKIIGGIIQHWNESTIYVHQLVFLFLGQQLPLYFALNLQVYNISIA